MIDMLVTAATQQRFNGRAIWNTPTLLSQLMIDNPIDRDTELGTARPNTL